MADCWKEGTMGPEFSDQEVLEQARGDSAATFHLATRWARERDGSVDTWASFFGREAARTWDEMGDDAPAIDVARQAALIMAGQADMRPIELAGGASRAEVLVTGPDPEYLDSFGTSREDIDRANELIFRAIAGRRGMTLETQREDAGWRLTFARR
jgi:hypothetical protein